MINKEVYDILMMNSTKVMVDCEASAKGFHVSSTATVSSAGSLVTTYTCTGNNGKKQITIVFQYNLDTNVIESIHGTCNSNTKVYQPQLIDATNVILPATFATTIKPFIKNLFNLT